MKIIKSNLVLFFLLALVTISFTSCGDDDVINYAKDLSGTYKSLSGDVKVVGALGNITISNARGSDALNKTINVTIKDKTSKKIAGVTTVTYVTSNSKVSISRVGDLITLSIASSEHVKDVTGLYIGTRKVD